MRRVTLILLAGGFGLGLLVVSVLMETRHRAWANVEEATQSAEIVSVEATASAVDYYLPYPGVLPDHPLYWLKMIRDKIILLVTRKPIDKYERLLLYADKRINAAKFLAEGNQLELAVTTATKAEKYLESASQQMATLSDDEQRKVRESLGKAYRKHMEILEEIEQRVPAAGKLTIEQAMTLTGEGLKHIVE